MVLNFLKLVFLTIGISSTPVWAGNADLLSLSQTAQWRALLHYFENDQSEIIHHFYFLSPEGKSNPLAELQATLSEFTHSSQKIGVLQQTPYCAFPARLAWLETQGFSFPKQDCKDQKEFIENIAPKSLTLVFSSAYPNNPASLFGHTMIRVNQGKNDPLLDYGVNYAAQVPGNETGIKYLAKGLFGMYPGTFGILPFYQKVLEYNEAESRDLWEYDLTFTEPESLFWVKHLWEMRFLAEFQYAFLKRNCSYQVIRTLQVLRPEKQNWLPSNFFYTLPGETIHDLKMKQPELFGEVHFRPSHFKILRNRYRFLNDEQASQFKADTAHPESIPHERDPYVLETLNSYYEYLKIQQQENAETSIKEKLRQIRVTRAKLGGVTQFPPLSDLAERTNQPDLAHGTRRAALTQQLGNHNSAETGIRFRLGLHDLLNRDDGYEANFGVAGGDVELTWVSNPNQTSHLRLKRFELFDIVSLQPITTGQFPVSWRVFSGWVPLLERNSLGENTDFETGGGVGITLEPSIDHVWTGIFFNMRSKIEAVIPSRKWAALSLEPFILFRVNKGLKSKLTFVAENDFEFSSALATQASLEASWSLGKSFELRGKNTQGFSSYLEHTNLNQWSLELGWFF